MTVTCMDCANIKRHQQANKDMYRTGWCGCAKQPAYVYLSRMRERECAMFVAKVVE